MMGEIASKSIQNNGKIMLCGNGGSAADAQHLAAEMLVRLRPNINREGVPAITLAQDTSTITACGNDFGYDTLYERNLRALGKEDCFHWNYNLRKFRKCNPSNEGCKRT